MSKPTSFKTRISTFENILTETIESVWDNTDWKKYLKGLSQSGEKISEQVIEIGKNSAEAISSIPKELTLEIHHHYVVSFLWMERAKSFLILWRDICFEQHKAHFLSLEGKVKRTLLKKVREESREIVTQAAAELHKSLKEQTDTTQSELGAGKRQIDRWSLQKNPWTVYEQQIDQLQQQYKDISTQFGQLKESHDQFKHITQLIYHTLETYEKDVLAVEDTFGNTQDFITNILKESDASHPNKIVNYVDGIEVNIQPKEHRALFNEALEALLKHLIPKQNVPVCLQDGWIQFREIPFQKSAQQWLESEIVPLLYEIGEQTEFLQIEQKKSLVNIRNRAVLLANELKEDKDTPFKGVNFLQPVELFGKRLAEFKEEFNQLKEQVNERISREFRIGNVFSIEQEFLPLSIQYTLNTFKIGQEKFLGVLQEWISHQVDRIRKLRRKVEEEDILSLSEKVVRYLQSRQIHPDNHHYASIFLTKGYVGESFWVGREEKIQHMNSLIENWKTGFRGAVILTGNRLSGKSFFGDLVSHHHFPENTLKIKPEQALEVEGRILNLSFDLEEALEFVKKYSLQNRPLIWIDDLETWCSPTIPLSKNIAALLEMVDSHSNRMFFMVSMTSWAKARMGQFHHIDEVFQAEINLDQMATNEIGEAILIRHGATHDILIDEQDNEIPPQKLRKMIKRISHTAEGNIGDALNIWAASIEKVETDKVRFRFRSGHGLPAFQQSDSMLILATVLVEKQTNEYRLSKLFGPVFQNHYSHVLQRLINIGLIVRRSDGLLQVSDLAVNDLAQILIQKNYVKLTS